MIHSVGTLDYWKDYWFKRGTLWAIYLSSHDIVHVLLPTLLAHWCTAKERVAILLYFKNRVF